MQESEAQLENEEARVLRAQLELTQLKQEIERRLNEKDEELESLRKNQMRQLEALQTSLDAEVKAKNDQVKQRKMVEGSIDDMQSSIDDLEKVSISKLSTVVLCHLPPPSSLTQALNDSLKKYKNSQAQLKEMNSLYEEEQRVREEQHGALVKAEKRANDFNVESEDMKAQLEQV